MHNENRKPKQIRCGQNVVIKSSQVDGTRDGLKDVSERLGNLDLLGVVALLLAQQEILSTVVGRDDPVAVLTLPLHEAVHDGL